MVWIKKNSSGIVGNLCQKKIRWDFLCSHECLDVKIGEFGCEKVMSISLSPYSQTQIKQMSAYARREREGEKR
jgi:hypothetical protein